MNISFFLLFCYYIFVMIMKKIIKLILTLLIIFGCFYYLDEITTYISKFLGNKPKVMISNPNEYYKKMDYEFVSDSKDFIPYSKEDLYDIFYSIFNRGYDTFTFYCPEEYKECISDVQSISDESSMITHINNFVSPFNSYSNVKITCGISSGEVNIDVTKLYSKEDIDIINKKIDEIIKSTIKDDMDDDDKVLAIHDYIINHTKYDVLREKGTSKYKSNTAYGALIEGYAVCGGYADAMSLFLDRFNIKNYKISTDTHVWNAIYINDNWLHLDLTWDDPVLENSSQDTLLHKFYLIDTKKLEDYKITDHEYDKTIYSELS